MSGAVSGGRFSCHKCQHVRGTVLLSQERRCRGMSGASVRGTVPLSHVSGVRVSGGRFPCHTLVIFTAVCCYGRNVTKRTISCEIMWE